MTIDNINNRHVTGKHLREDEMETTVDVTPLKQVEKLPSIVDAELTTSDKFQKTNTKKAGKVNSLDYSDTISTSDHRKAKTFDVSFDEYVSSGRVNIQDKSDNIAESSEDLEDENNEEIKFNLDDISRELQCEPAIKGVQTYSEPCYTRVKKKADLSCVVDDITILNSEIKPLKCITLQQKKVTVKTQLRARKSINMQLQRKGGPAEASIFLNMGEWMKTFFMDLKYNRLYHSWLFYRIKLVIEKASIPLAEFAISHIIALK
ncbi:7131_t:CDS:2, partial [Funneliformis caledonium]